ncbi:MAG: S-adenosyl methyltransferase [Streptosporangiaceae bacterium]|nr:S-adenosyl methyltransferase [Streptosporangiaceae bacterium]
MAEIPGIHITRPHAARVYDWALGGNDHYEADREYGEQVVACDSRRRPA